MTLASARFSQKIEAAMAPDTTVGSGRCSPNRRCCIATEVKMAQRLSKKVCMRPRTTGSWVSFVGRIIRLEL